MKNFLVLLIIIFFNISSANADYITTNTFVVDVSNTVTIVTSGNLTSTIDPFTGQMSTPLHINFNITSNEDLSNINLKAYVTDSTSVKSSGFYCTDTSEVTSQSMYLVFTDSDDEVATASINDCKQAASTPMSNPNVIAYPGTVSINNDGTIQYNQNGGDGYFSSQIKTGTTDLNMTISTTPKPGTYDFNTAEDESDTYQVEIYLDNIPG